MAKKDKQVQIYPTRRQTDAARMAQALLHLVDRLPAKDKAYFVTEGERLIKDLRIQPKSKGSAA